MTHRCFDVRFDRKIWLHAQKWTLCWTCLPTRERVHKGTSIDPFLDKTQPEPQSYITFGAV